MARVKVGDVMTKKVITVNEDTPIEYAARTMVDNRIGGLPVVNSENAVVGIITETDIFKTFLELIGARKPGVRITLIAKDERGGLARMSKAIADAGGNIVASVEVPGTNSTNYEVLMKVTGVSKEALVEAVPTGCGAHHRRARGLPKPSSRRRMMSHQAPGAMPGTALGQRHAPALHNPAWLTGS